MNTIKKWTRKLIALALAIISTVTLVIPMRAQAAEYINYYGGCEIARENLNVYSTSDCTYKIGTIYKYEGYTVLLKNSPEDYMWVEYSTPSGTKRGYVSVPRDEDSIENLTCNIFPKIAEKYKEKSYINVKWCINQVINTMYNNTSMDIISKYFNLEENVKPSLKFIIYTIVNKYNRKYQIL